METGALGTADSGLGYLTLGYELIDAVVEPEAPLRIKPAVLAALESVLSNSWAIELPQNPTFPASVFNIETASEDAWVQGGGYDQHTVTVVVLSRDLDQLDTLWKQARDAVEAIPGFMYDGDNGDAEYEGDANVYGYYFITVIRLPTH